MRISAAIELLPKVASLQKIGSERAKPLESRI